MKISYDSTQLIADVKEDIKLFGKDFKVFAVYAYQEIRGEEFEYISCYVDADRPTPDEADDSEEFLEMLADYEANIASLHETKNELMTLADLLPKLIEQDSII